MSTPIFVSHENWNIKTPFVSYSDQKFIDELVKERQKENDTQDDYILSQKYNASDSKIIEYFTNRNSHNKIYGVTSSFVNYFKDVKKRKLDKQKEKLLKEKANSENKNICSLLAKLFN